jgi:hypothetical protein
MNYEFTLAVDRDPTEMADGLFDIAEGNLVPEGGTGGLDVPSESRQQPVVLIFKFGDSALSDAETL